MKQKNRSINYDITLTWWLACSFIITSIQCIEEVWFFEMYPGYFFALYGFDQHTSQTQFLVAILQQKTIQLFLTIIAIVFQKNIFGKFLISFLAVVHIIFCGFVFSAELIISGGIYVTGAVLGLIMVFPYHVFFVKELLKRNILTTRSVIFHFFVATALGSIIILFSFYSYQWGVGY